MYTCYASASVVLLGGCFLIRASPRLICINLVDVNEPHCVSLIKTEWTAASHWNGLSHVEHHGGPSCDR